jgi:hypothetical protein
MSWQSLLEFSMPAPGRETFEPEVLALLGSIYDEAWASVAADYAHADADTLAEARAELAAIMLRLAEHQLASGELKDQAIRQFRHAMAPSAPQLATPTDRAVTQTARHGVNVPVN